MSADDGQSEWSLADCQELLDDILLKRKVTSVDYASEETTSHILAKKNPEYPAVMSSAGDDPGGRVKNLIQSLQAGLQRFRDGARPIIVGNPVTFEEIECAKKSNLKFGEVDGLEELLGDD